MNKNFLFTLLILVTSVLVSAQAISGKWMGLLKVPGGQLRLVFNIEKTADGYASTMDSPDQNAKGIPVESTTWSQNTLSLALPAGKISYSGRLDSGRITGTFVQNGMQIPLVLEKETAANTLKRPQDPQPPYPYREEEITFQDIIAGNQLGGTLTLPANSAKSPAVILISGSGAQDRNSEIFEHKPFKVIADFLSKNGIAVLRYDDRGVGKSTGSFAGSTSADFATDVTAAIDYLKTRADIGQIGLIGHSEGGLIAPMVASKSPDISFIVLLAGTGIRGDKLMLLQQQKIWRVSGYNEKTMKQLGDMNKKTFEVILKQPDKTLLTEELKTRFTTLAKDNKTPVKPANVSEEEYVKVQLAQYTNPWMLYFLRYDPASSLTSVKCPVLALNGSLDLQVPPAENLAAIKAALEKGGNKQVTTKELPGLNHLFQESKTGAPAEYGAIEQTFSPLALQEMLGWIRSVIKK